MSRLYSKVFAVLLVLPLIIHSKLTVHGSDSRVFGSEPKMVRCIEAERQALLKFKQDLYGRYYDVNVTTLLSSWGGKEENKDCCEWLGIKCANKSGHVIMLDLSPSTFSTDYNLFRFRGNISTLLVELRYLNYLHLSFIDFKYSRIPSSIGMLSELRYLNLSSTYMSGEIPPQFSNLTRLEVLDLGYCYNYRIESLDWISNLSSLRKLDLSGTNMSKANHWMEILTKLPHLTYLRLANCQLPNIVPSSLSLRNSSTSLTHLDLSNNNLHGTIDKWLFNFSYSLFHLDLSSNMLEGSFPEALWNMTALEYLALSGNKLEGAFPNSFWNLCELRFLYAGGNNISGRLPEYTQSLCGSTHYPLEHLYLGRNRIMGSIPEIIWKLTELSDLDISGNSLEGVITEAHFSKLSKLSYLDLAYNSLTLNISSDWIPPFQLDIIALGSINLGPHFPKWLQTQKNYYFLDISSSKIADSIPGWFWDVPTRFYKMDLSKNQIQGKIANFSFKFANPEIDLSSNQLEGSVPEFLFQVGRLNLSMNSFSDVKSLCDVVDDSELTMLDISYNKLSGDLPDCWSNFKSLNILILANNKFSGKIPISLGSLSSIVSMHLGTNNLSGELPSSLENCKNLTVLDLRENNLSGPIPIWIGKNLPGLIILSLQSNHFYGSIPSFLCDLAQLQVLDLSLNNISSDIPNCLGNLTAMKVGSNSRPTIRSGSEFVSANISYGFTYEEELVLLWKGKFWKYKSILGLVRSIDLSSNNLIGEIPREIVELTGLVFLNLSRNKLVGPIPPEIGKLEILDALDLSNNQLSGEIPLSLSEVDRLNTLDLSNNNLSGKIPTSTQLQSFNATAYMGNPQLCGEPLLTKCLGDEPTSTDNEEDRDDFLITRGFYVSLGLGFVIGFWGVCGSLIFRRSWRYACFKFLNDVRDVVYVTVAIHKAKMLRMIQS